MNINVEVIPHDQHRYPTVGDWWTDEKGVLQLRVSDIGNEDFQNLVALHELVEVLLCKKRGITTEQVDAFDKQFEKDRAEGLHSETEEPGDHPDAPYRREHYFATKLERLMCRELGVHWDTYEAAINKLP